jgi:hypothetical protein
MGQPKLSFFAGQIVLPATALVVVWIVIAFTSSCAGTTEQAKTVKSADADPTIEVDESQLQRPPLRFDGLMPADPQPTGESLRPGLSVLYYYSYFKRHLDPLEAIAAAPGRGQAGKPIPYLNHSFGREEVFDSGTNRGVAMRMKGLIRFPKPGEYTFRAITNDGLRIYIGDVRIIDDPENLPNRYTVQAVVDIQHKGWYPLQVEYFQRKGTATIGLFWRTPAARDFVPVPAKSFAHLP